MRHWGKKGPDERRVAEVVIFAAVYSVSRADGRLPVTHARAHKQGFGPLEKITSIITGCTWTCPPRGGGGGDRVLTEKEQKEREQATSAGAFLRAVSRRCSVSLPFTQRFPHGGEHAKDY